MFKRLLESPSDYTEEMDRLQFARDAAHEALSHLPEDSSIWTDEQWTERDLWEGKIPSLSELAERPCRCRGIVTFREGLAFRLELDPKPKHRLVPHEVQFWGSMEAHDPSTLRQLFPLSVGDRVSILGVFRPPIRALFEGATGHWFELKESRAFRREVYGNYA